MAKFKGYLAGGKFFTERKEAIRYAKKLAIREDAFVDVAPISVKITGKIINAYDLVKGEREWKKGHDSYTKEIRKVI